MHDAMAYRALHSVSLRCPGASVQGHPLSVAPYIVRSNGQVELVFGVVILDNQSMLGALSQSPLHCFWLVVATAEVNLVSCCLQR